MKTLRESSMTQTAAEHRAGASIPFYLHDLGESELASVAAVLRQPVLTSGATVAEFERRFADWLERRHAVAVNSCTGALHMALLGLGIGPGDEVITTPLTFVATAAAICEAGARPVFVDVEPDTGNLDVARVESAITARTRAILPVHLYGLMCDMRSLRVIADRHRLKLIEDAAHCVEGMRDGVRPGQLSDAACFSFYATKNLTCGEGGALVTDDDALAERLRLLRLHGITKSGYDRSREGYSHWDMVMLGWKYNMSNIEAALLLPQLERIDDNLCRRHALAARYEAALDAAGIAYFAGRPRSIHARHVFPVRVPDRDRVIAQLAQHGIGSVVNYQAIHLTTYFTATLCYRRGDFPIAEQLGDETLSLPFYPKLPEQHVDEVVACVRRALDDAQLAEEAESPCPRAS